jgi:hypothetical protein
MKLFSVVLACTLAAATAQIPLTQADSSPKCLSKSEATNIATHWLSIWNTPSSVKSLAQLSTIVADDIWSADDTFGPPTTTKEDIWNSISGSGPFEIIETQTPHWLIHSCDGIAAHWLYQGKTTDVNT